MAYKITKRRSGIRRMARKSAVKPRYVKKALSKRTAALKWKRMMCTEEIKQIVDNFTGTDVNGTNWYIRSGSGVDLNAVYRTGTAVNGIVPTPSYGTNDGQRVGDEILVKALTFHLQIRQSSVQGGDLRFRLVFFTLPRESSSTGNLTGFFKFNHFQQGMLGTINRENVTVLYDKTFTVRNGGATANQVNTVVRGTIFKNRRMTFVAGGVTPKHSKNRVFMVIMGGRQGVADGSVGGTFSLITKMSYTG